MKVRTGFVSNSSSSSFYMIAPKDILKDNDRLKSFIKKYLLDGRDRVLDSYGDNAIPIDKIVEHIKDGHDIVKKSDMKSMHKSYVDELAMEQKDLRGWKFMIEYYKEVIQFTDVILENMKPCSPDLKKIIISWEWGDEDGSYWSALEHRTHPKYDKDKKEGIIRKSNH